MLLPLPPSSCSCVGSWRPTAWRRRRALQALPPPPLAARGASGPRPRSAARRCSPRPLPAPPPWREIRHLRRAARLWASSSSRIRWSGARELGHCGRAVWPWAPPYQLISLVVGDEMAACLPAAALACTNGERHETEGEEPREITDEGKKVKW